MTATAAGKGVRQTRPAPEPAMQVEDDRDEAPVIVALRSPENPAAEERVAAFSINGEVYTMLAKPKTNAGLKYIHLARTMGTEAAIDYLLEALLGVDGYQALINFDDLTQDDLMAVIDKASKIMTGTVENPKDTRKPASRKSRG